jgi:hypothetical protein
MTAPVQPPTDDDKRSALERWRAAMFKTTDKSWANQFNAETKHLAEQTRSPKPDQQKETR